ncbi:MAG TPA: hypothetical protein PKA53_04515 [Sphingobacterium sp.]|nr:hypothetical protein [Sphingobacterium sp.]
MAKLSFSILLFGLVTNSLMIPRRGWWSASSQTGSHQPQVFSSLNTYATRPDTRATPYGQSG